MDDSNGEKTEPPTPRRRMEARSKGQVARSQELSAAITLLGGLVALKLFGRHLWLTMANIMRRGLSPGDSSALDEHLVYGSRSLAAVGYALAPVLLMLVGLAIVSVYAQVGWLLTFEPLKPDLNKLNPLSGIKRLFSVNSVVRLVQSILKMVAVVGVAVLVVRGVIERILLAHLLSSTEVFAAAADLLFDLGMKLAIVVLALAIIDFVYQRYRHEKQLKMTKEEVKEEMRRMDGDPIIKRRRREIQLKLAAERLKSSVPTADVVVTNPTHYAVAIRYDTETMAAPRVVAKGADVLAQRIREIAAVASIPIVEKPLLARALYKDVESGGEIPERFYRAVAEILAYVYEISGRRIGPSAVPVS